MRLLLEAIVLAQLLLCSLTVIEGGVTRRGAAASYCPDETPYMKSGRCTADCGPGIYGDDAQKTCLPCSEKCKTCLGNSEYCTSCNDPLYLLNNKCEESCGTLLSRGPARGRVRLSGGQNDFEGVVQILHEGVFGTICDDGWNMNAANVICRELQLGDAQEAVNAADAGFSPVPARTPILLDNINCRGDESNVQFCGHGSWYSQTCGHFEDAGVRCTGPDVSRLCVSECGDGFYQVPNTQECQLCDETCETCSESADHCLTCDAPRFLRDHRCLEDCGFGYYGDTRTRTCQPCSTSCKNCQDGPTNSVCTSCEDDRFLSNGVCVSACEPKLSKHLAIRLAGGTTPFEGRVEVFINGDWGTVCDDLFDIHDAEVVCRQLGFGHALAAVTSPGFGPGSNKILIDDLRCNGTEAELVNCAQSAFNENNCNHHEDAGVQCSGTESIEITQGSVTRTVPHPGATGACVDSCDVGYFVRGSQCVACSASCLACEGSADHCTECKAPSFLQGSSCVTACNSDQFGNTVTSRCEPCDLTSCRTCANGERNNICTSCPAGRYMKGTSCVLSCGPDMYLLNGSCVADCGQGRYRNPSIPLCETCPDRCLTCGYDDSLNLKCSTCKPPKVLDASTGTCVDRCPSDMFAAMLDPSDINLGQQTRLVGGRNQLEGRIEVFYENQWGTVCDDFFDIDAAHVACRALGLGNAVRILSIGPETGIAPGEELIWLDDLLCQGFETSLANCHHSPWGEHNCNHDRDAAIQCSGPGLRECQTSCPRGYYTSAADQSCQPCQASCLECNASPTYTCTSCQQGTHLLGDQCVDDCGHGYHANDGRCIPCSSNCATCQGEQTHCTSCDSSKFLQDNTCVDTCRGYKFQKTDAVRLVGGSSPLEGRVEIKIGNNTYGTVCDDQWDILDAGVVCRQLGFGSAVEASIAAKFGLGSGSIYLDNLSCTGTEANLLQCKNSGQGLHDCNHLEDAGVICSGPDTTNMCIDVAHCNNGKFVTSTGDSCGVCDPNCATCSGRSTHCLTCPEGKVLRSDNTCGDQCAEGSFADETHVCHRCSEQCLACSESASACTKCGSNLYLNTDTQTCVASCTDGLVMQGSPDIRLVGGPNNLQGRVEIYHNNEWGTICDDSFDISDAQVVCRQLNLGNAEQYSTGASFGQGSGPIWLDELQCNGDEQAVTDCRRADMRIGSHDCGHNEDVGVICAGPDTSLKCVSSCEDGYFANANDECERCSGDCLTCQDSADQCTSCHAPHFLNGTSCLTACPAGQYGNVISRLCEACDPSCKECFDGKTNTMCKTCRPDFYLQGSSCVPTCQDGFHPISEILQSLGDSAEVRLTGGSNQREGRVEISHNGEWGTICNNNWDFTDADVVCHQLGLGRAIDILSTRTFGEASSDTPIWLTGVDCKGWEMGISQCANAGWGNTGCTHRGDVAIRCDGATDLKRDNMCRQKLSSPCTASTCSGGVECAPLGPDRDQAVCLECPENEIGSGTDCTVVASTPPTFTEEPKNRTVHIGSAANFKCKAGGVHPPRVTAASWLKDGRPLNQQDLDSGRIRVFTSSGTLQFLRTRREDSGNYTCVLVNTEGANSSSAFLIVKEQPHISSVKHSQRVLGETAELGCTAMGLPQATFTWQRNGEALSGDRFQTFSDNGTLFIRGVTHADNGDYQCVAVNQLGEDFATVTLTVREPPTIQAVRSKIEIKEGSEFELPCVVKGVPQPSVTWKKNGEVLSLLTGRVVVRDDGTLVIKNAQREDMADYACIASNVVQTSAQFTKLLLIGPPHITEGPSNQTLTTGETLTLPCEVIGAFDPDVTWEHNGKHVREDFQRHQIVKGALIVTNVDPMDSGVYKCTASNSEGSISEEAYVTVSGPIRIGQHRQVGTNTVLIVVIVLLFIIIVIVVVVFVRRRRCRSEKVMSANAIFKGATNPLTMTFPSRRYQQFQEEEPEGVDEETEKQNKTKNKTKKSSSKEFSLLEEEEGL